ncbi:MAG TPA: FHA domain-containing protein [Candidatus Gallacutalibacter stercoravium]|nr:FHA domain-containing protein [Candidatus Gallacutalibacter stercoravium]
MKRCPNGHYYDHSKNPTCPYCSGASANANVTLPLDNGRTVAQNVAPGTVGPTVPVSPVPQATPTAPVYSPAPASNSDGERTVAVIRQKIGIDPVVGWLVCIEGKDKGTDYRIHSDNNYIGRGEKMDICIHGDDTISRENHAIVSYDMRDKIFYFSPGDGRSIVRLNGKALFMTAELAPYDRIELGGTVLMFIPFCGKEFDWE